MQRRDILRMCLAAAPFVACIVVYFPTLSGGFLSDDYAVIGALSEWTREGTLWTSLLHKFYSGLDAPSHYYRPLALLSFGINYVAGGAHPIGWRIANLCVHLLSGALVFVIVERLAFLHQRRASVEGAALGSAAFLLFPTSPEAVAWVSGRYDLLATMFLLATVALFQRSRSRFDAWSAAAMLTAAAALASKESGVLVAVAVAAVAIGRHSEDPTPVRRGLRDAVPWIVLTIAYFALRAAMFGDPLQVYPGTSPLGSLLHGDWLRVMVSLDSWFAAILPSPRSRGGFLLGLSALLLIGALRSARRRSLRATWWPLAGTAALSVALVLPHLQGLSSNGEQGRLFYTTAALLALIVPAALSRGAVVSARSWTRLAAPAAAILLIACEMALVRASIEMWTTAGSQATRLLDGIPEIARQIPESGYGFVLVPDHIAAVPFGRNGQGGMVDPPVQQAALSHRLIVQTPDDLPPWPENARVGLVDALRRYPLGQIWSEIAAGHASGAAMPTHYFCWGADGVNILPVAIDANSAMTRAAWLASWRKALAETRCAIPASDLPAT